jgi:hypothetical protein
MTPLESFKCEELQYTAEYLEKNYEKEICVGMSDGDYTGPIYVESSAAKAARFIRAYLASTTPAADRKFDTQREIGRLLGWPRDYDTTAYPTLEEALLGALQSAFGSVCESDTDPAIPDNGFPDRIRLRLLAKAISKHHSWVTQAWASERFGSDREGKFVALAGPRNILAILDREAQYREAIALVCEGWNISEGVRKILETALFA